ncbi:MAG TPA: hypothetical protein VGB76_03140 [Pyrinomonadaceae bacterium]|jgi:hypothetical protein
MSKQINRLLGRTRLLVLTIAVIAAVCVATVALAVNSEPGSAAVNTGAAAPADAGSSHTQGRGSFAAYTLEQRQTFTPQGGEPFVNAKKERYQRSDGVFLLVHTYYRPDGSVITVETGLGYLGSGAYRVDEKNNLLEFVAVQDSDAPTATEEQLRADPGFEQEETLAGQRTLVARYSEKGAAANYRQVYRAPELQNLALKTVIVSPRGEEIIEPVRLDPGEPPATLFDKALRYRKSYARYEERIRQTEQKGDVERASMMRKHLARVRG